MSKSSSSAGNARLGDLAWAKMDKISAELFAMTYGAIVTQMLKDYEDVEAVNTELDKMGYNVGCRLIDEFLSKSSIQSCHNFKETADTIAKVAFKMFLGVSAEVTSWSDDSKQCSLILAAHDNPFAEFVELPPQYKDLVYCQLLCGVLRGALEMVQLKIECEFVRDVLRGDDVYEIRMRLKEIMQDNYQADDE